MIITGQDRNQTVLFTTYEDMISPENSVRIIDYLINQIIEENEKSFEYKGKSKEGRPAYPFSVLLKLYIYGYINRIKSTRSLEKECYRNIELIWLLHGLKPDFKTISNFRSEYGKIISEFNRLFKRKLKALGLIGQEFAVDGSKFKANANHEILTRQDIVKQLVDLDKALHGYFVSLDNADKGEETIEFEKQIANEQIEKLEKEIDRLNQYIEKMDSQGKNYISPTDLDCNMMRNRDGKIPAFNVQIAVDSESGFIAGEYVTVSANDINELPKIIQTTLEELEIEEITTLSDCGYANLDDIEELEKTERITCYSALPLEQREKGFKYDCEKDIFICPENKEMKRVSIKDGRGKSQRIIYRCSECDECPIRINCTKSKEGRQVQRYTNQDFRDSYRQRMQEKLSKSKIRRRKSVVECVFGSLKVTGGKIPILTRGLKKVTTEIKLYTLSYNFKHLLSMINLTDLKEKWVIAATLMSKNYYKFEILDIFQKFFPIKCNCLYGKYNFS